jgi:hypothetical protein
VANVVPSPNASAAPGAKPKGAPARRTGITIPTLLAAGAGGWPTPNPGTAAATTGTAPAPTIGAARAATTGTARPAIAGAAQAATTSTPASYIGHIVVWSGDTQTYKTAWLVGPDGHRRWISDAATYNCLKANGAPGPDALSSTMLDALPDEYNVWAVCGASRIGTNSMLQTGFYARSPNGGYTLRLTQSNLTLTDSSGHVVWSTGHGGSALLLQGDGNLVEYAGNTPVWASNTSGSGAVWLDVTNDGHLTLSNSNGTVVWNR